MTPLQTFLAEATAAEQQRLAEAAGTSRAHLRHLNTGKRHASADLASRIERASKRLHKQSAGRLPLIPRTSLCAACMACEFAKLAKDL